MKGKSVHILLMLSVYFLLVTDVKSQDWESGILAGASNYAGDFSYYPLLEETHPSFGVFLKKNLSSYISLDGSLNYGRISGNDQNLDYLNARNLSFQSDIFEFSFQMEYNFFPFVIGMDAKNHTPFIFTGISAFYFNPETEFEGETVELRPLKTEGQGLEDGPSEYSKFSIAWPIGLGYRFDLQSNWILGLKAGVRISFTDYLDDVSGNYYPADVLEEEVGDLSAVLSDRSDDSNALGVAGKQRGSPLNTDYFMFARLAISYQINNPECFEF